VKIATRLALAALLAAPAASPAAPADRIVLLEQGLRVTHGGRTDLLRFERTSRAEVERRLAFLGTPRRSSAIPECPAGPLKFTDYPGGLQLSFSDGKLAGYWVSAARRPVPAATVGRLRVGSPRSALGKAKVEETSVGLMADVGGVVAALDERGRKVDALYSGLACIFD
jgi:hypothetical protein